MIEKLKEDIDAEKASWDFSLFMTRNWDSFHGRWGVESDFEEAVRSADHSKIAELEREVSRVRDEAIQLEEHVYLTRIAAGKASKEWVGRYVSANSGGATPEQVDEFAKMFAATFDKELQRAEAQLANHREEHDLSCDHE